MQLRATSKSQSYTRIEGHTRSDLNVKYKTKSSLAPVNNGQKPDHAHTDKQRNNGLRSQGWHLKTSQHTLPLKIIDSWQFE